jgi:hypothetical protein
MNVPYDTEITDENTDNLPEWDLSHIPNYDTALPIHTVNAEELSEERFYREFVLQNRPCLILGAVKNWPAFKKWKSSAYLATHTDNKVVRARKAPMWELLPEAAETLQEMQEHNRSIFLDVPFHDFLAGEHESDQFVMHGMPVRSDNLFSKLLSDIGTYSFLSKPAKPRLYFPIRAFLYWGSYTDWHYHPADETLMSQIVGDKEVLVLPPDDHTWEALHPIARAQSRMYGVDGARFPKFKDLRPQRIIVGAGDALYIPVYWWHVVATLDQNFGVTLATTFKTPLHINGDLRFPAARLTLRRLLKTRAAPLALAAVAYSYLHRLTSILHKSVRKVAINS